MKVKELIEELKKLNPEYEVETFVDYDESGTGTIFKVISGTWGDPDKEIVMISFDFDGCI